MIRSISIAHHEWCPLILGDILVPNSNIYANTVDVKVMKQAKKQSREVDESSTRLKWKALPLNNANTSSLELPTSLILFDAINNNRYNTVDHAYPPYLHF